VVDTVRRVVMKMMESKAAPKMKKTEEANEPVSKAVDQAP